jgi:L,D-transpeptidase ErfK/SrfK
MKRKNLALILSACLLFATQALHAETYAVDADGGAIVGTATYISAGYGDTLSGIAQRYDLGLNAVIDANPDINPRRALGAGTQVAIPASHILPSLTHRGIVINLPEMRMYYYASDGVVKTYPIGIGRVGKTIPLAHTFVVRKTENPIWIPPEDIIAFNLQKGVKLPKIMPAGPDNPLGPYAIYLSIPTYLIHSTIFPDSVGTRASFGCIRMHESDIKDFYPLITNGTSVTIIDMPTKVGWEKSSLYLETHDPLEEHSSEFNAGYFGMIASIDNATGANIPAFVDWQEVADLAEIRDGTPHDIGFKIGS